MTIQTLASKIAKHEGKKSQAKIGDIREILKLIAQFEAEHVMDNPGIQDGPIDVLELESDKIFLRLRKKQTRIVRKTK